MQRKEKLFNSKRDKKKKLKQLKKFADGDFNKNDDSFKKKQTGNFIINSVLKEDLKDQFKENPDII